MKRTLQASGGAAWSDLRGGMSLAEMGEFALIRQIREGLDGTLLPAPGLTLGIGDDTCSYVPTPGMELLLTSDSAVEGRHYLAEFSSPYDVGRRVMAMNLSDIGAMGGVPRLALVSLGLPPETPVAAVDELYRGFAAELVAAGCCIAGGNLTAVDQQAFLDVTLLGEVERGAAVRRAGALAGDVLLLTGYPGVGAAGLAVLRHDARWAQREMPDLVASYLRPSHRGREGRAAGQSDVAHAMIDVSDGLLGDLAHMCSASRVGARVEVARLPRHPELQAAAVHLEVDPRDWLLGPSDDYELLIACAAGDAAKLREVLQQVAGVPATEIGRMVEGTGVELVDAAGDPPTPARGWDHFRGSSI